MRVVSVVSVPSGSWSYYAPKIYAPVRTRRGRWIWRPVEAPLGTLIRNGWELYRGFRSIGKAYQVARDLADLDDDLLVDFRVGFGTPVDLTKYGEIMIEEGLLARDELTDLLNFWS